VIARAYRRLILAPGSALVALVGSVWLVERVLDTSIAPFLQSA
jgi:hypothetical protein